MQNFVYLVGDPVARECVVVDPAWEIDTIVDTTQADGMRLTGALVTHTHQDHVGGSLASWGMPGRIPGVEELLTRVPLKVYVHKAEREFLPGLGSDLVKVDNHDTLPIGRLMLTFLHTPGHTPGSQCFLVDGRLVSGDTLFIGSCGRTDLPGSDPSEMYYSLTQRLGALPDDTLLFPGHNYGGPSSTIGDEKRRNPFMRFASLGEFHRVISGHDVATLLTRHGFDFFTGVPCSLVEDVIAVLEGERDAPYIAVVREDAAVGLAAGAWFAGRRPCVLMQNSGLGTSLNALASLSLMYGLPALVVVTWRGHEGKDAPEHILTGRITPQILDLLGVPYRVLSAGTAAADVAWAAKEMDTLMQPVAIVVPPKVVATGIGHREPVIARPSGPGGSAKGPRRQIQRSVDSRPETLTPT